MNTLLDQYYTKEQAMFDKINNRFRLESELEEILQEIAEKYQEKLESIDIDDFGSEVKVHQLKEARNQEMMETELDYTKRLLKNEQETGGLLDQMNDMQLPVFEIYVNEYEKQKIMKQVDTLNKERKDRIKKLYDQHENQDDEVFDAQNFGSSYACAEPDFHYDKLVEESDLKQAVDNVNSEFDRKIKNLFEKNGFDHLIPFFIKNAIDDEELAV